MKKFFRWFFVVLAAVAATLLGVHEIGGTPISRGYDTGFKWVAADPSRSRLLLTAEPDGGDMVCWIRLKLPATISDLNAEISTGVSLSVSPREKDGADQWFEITKKSSVAQDKFDWGSGATLFLYSQANQTPLEIKDWYIFPNNKDFDSRHRAKWRALWFWISLAALLIACMGVIAERLSKEPSKPEFSAQFCVKLLIESIDGKDSKESESMRWLLKKVLIEKTPVNAALSALPLKNLKKWERRGLWFRTADQFRKKLEELIIDLDQYLSYVKKP